MTMYAAWSFLLLWAIRTYGAPATTDLVILNQTCQGCVFAATPLARPCFTTLDGRPTSKLQAQCEEVQANYTSGEFRSSQYSGFMQDYDETCASSEDARYAKCLLDPSDPAASIAALGNASCGQGSVSRHYVEVNSASDVQAAFAYAHQQNQSISIKNSGHDYLSRSSLRGSLAIWTQKLQRMNYNARFVPQGCSISFAAMTLGAGVSLDQAYSFAEENNVTFMGGSSPTVGASGGFVMTGGHGLLSAQLGLAIDRVLEYRIVTPDGVLRTANACQNPDLFWALRGGGGGTFGVVLETTSKVEARMGMIFALIEMPVENGSMAEFTQILMEHAVGWSQEGWGGPNSAASVAMANPFLSLEQAQASMAPLSSYVESVGGTVSIEQYPSFYGVYQEYIRPSGDDDVGTALLTTNRLIPTDMMASAEGRQQIQAYLDGLQRAGFATTIFQTPPAYFQTHGGPQQAEATSATPAWRDSVWMLTSNTQWAWNASVAAKRATVAALQNMTEAGRSLAPDSGAYTSEADPWTSDWQEAWWGSANYARLLRLKHQYDPLRILSCWRCVGWEERLAAPGQPFNCMGGLNRWSE